MMAIGSVWETAERIAFKRWSMKLFTGYFFVGRQILVALLLTSCAWAADAGLVLTSTTSLAAVVEPTGTRDWRHGGFIMIDMVNPLAKTFTIVDRDGLVSSIFDFSIPDTSRVWVLGSDRDYAGNVVFAGRATSRDGRYAPFIAIKSAQGGDVQLIRTYPYWPVLLSVAPDGTIWTTGEEMTSEGKVNAVGINPNPDVLRHFDRSGKLLGSAVPRKTVFPGDRFAHGYLVATSDRVGWYSPIHGPGTYVELSPTLDNVKVYNGLSNEKGQADGFALTESGKVFVTHYAQQKQATYTLDRASSHWTEVPFAASDSLVLRGSEKNTLVFESVKGLLFFDMPQSLANR